MRNIDQLPVAVGGRLTQRAVASVRRGNRMPHNSGSYSGVTQSHARLECGHGHARLFGLGSLALLLVLACTEAVTSAFAQSPTPALPVPVAGMPAVLVASVPEKKSVIDL